MIPLPVCHTSFSTLERNACCLNACPRSVSVAARFACYPLAGTMVPSLRAWNSLTLASSLHCLLKVAHALRRGTWTPMRRYLEALPASLKVVPRALLVVSAHWDEPRPTVLTSPSPPMLFDYYGFPPHTYKLSWPAPGATDVAARVRELLSNQGIASADDATRGFDHGTFVPLMVSFPDAKIPTTQLSLVRGLDAATHLSIGAALAPLRDEGVLIVASGMSYHNLSKLRGPPSAEVASASNAFDSWLVQALCTDATPEARRAMLQRWTDAPSAKSCHPPGAIARTPHASIIQSFAHHRYQAGRSISCLASSPRVLRAIKQPSKRSPTPACPALVSAHSNGATLEITSVGVCKQMKVPS